MAFIPSYVEPGQYFLSKKMEVAGFKVTWIVHSTGEKQWLVRLGANPRDILDTSPPSEHQYPECEIEERLRRLENGKPPFVNEIIAMDRRLCLKSDVEARRYLAHIEKVLTDFLVSRDVQFISHGRDTALHLACHKICERLGISSVVATEVRIPEGKFGFFQGYMPSEFVELGPVTSQHIDEAARIVDDFLDKPVVPLSSVLQRSNQSFLGRLHKDFALWCSLSWRGLADIGNDIGRYSSGQLLRMAIRRRWNAMQTKRAGLFDPVGKRPYIYYPMHMQPESTIDVVGSFVSNQHNLVSLIAKSTPCTHDIYVKPHPDDLGGRSRSDLLAFKRIPGVRLISPYQNGASLVRGASLTLTPTGTSAMESSLLGKPSVIFADMYFSKMPHVHYCRCLGDLPKLIPHLLELPAENKREDAVRFIAHLLANSFDGRFIEYLGPLSEKETESLIQAYSIVYDKLRGEDKRAVL